MSHTPDETLELLSEFIQDNLPEGQPYVLITSGEADNHLQLDMDFISNVEPPEAAKMLRDTAEVLDSACQPEEPEAQPPPWSR